MYLISTHAAGLHSQGLVAVATTNDKAGRTQTTRRKAKACTLVYRAKPRFYPSAMITIAVWTACRVHTLCDNRRVWNRVERMDRHV